MARRIYSLQFYSAKGLSGNGPTIVVPDDHVYVVKQLTFYTDPALGVVRGFFEDVGTGGTLFATAGNIGAGTWEGFYGALVFEAGMSFRWKVSSTLTDAADVSVSGYDLLNT